MNVRPQHINQQLHALNRCMDTCALYYNILEEGRVVGGGGPEERSHLIVIRVGVTISRDRSVPLQRAPGVAAPRCSRRALRAAWALLAIVIVGECPRRRVVVWWKFGVVELAAAGGDVAMGFEPLRHRDPVCADPRHAKVRFEIPRFGEIGPSSGQERVAGGAAHRLLRVSAVERQRLLREVVEMWRQCLFLAISAHLGSQIVHHYQ